MPSVLFTASRVRRPGFAKLLGDNFVLSCQTASTVHDEEHDVSLVNCLQRLLRHLVQNAFRRHGLEASGIDHEIGPVAQLAVSVMTVARQSRYIGHQRVATACQTVKERGLADVGSPYQYESGFHDFSFRLTALGCP